MVSVWCTSTSSSSSGSLLFALQGAYRGLVAQALSLVGLAIGALAGSWIAPKLLSEGSAWVAIASLVGAIIGASLLGAASATLAEIAAALPRLPAGTSCSGLRRWRRARARRSASRSPG